MSLTVRAEGPLVARAELLDPGSDPLDAWEPGGFFFEHRAGAVAARGSAVTITIPAGPDHVGRAASMAREALARISWTEGPAPVVVGALPFGGSTPSMLTIPRVAVIKRGDEVWRIGIGAPGEPVVEAVETGTGSLRIQAVPAPESYVSAVARAREKIRAGALNKVVLARMLVVHADHAFDRRALLRGLRSAEPGSYVFGVGGFLGASPELLVARYGDEVEAVPLAGTIPRRDGDADEQAGRELLASEKDRREHAYVVEAVHASLAPVCEQLAVDAEPSLLATSKLWHLATRARGVLRGPAPTALEIAARLHPTPAVCGSPTEAARAAIAELEDIDRTLYAGAVGWMDASGDGEWAVALRCAEVQGRIAMLFAGAGIVAESDPQAELAETDAKFRAMLDALGAA